jgi:hypothetical protein
VPSPEFTTRTDGPKAETTIAFGLSPTLIG